MSTPEMSDAEVIAVSLLLRLGYTLSKKPESKQVTVVVIRSQVTGLWGWMVYNQKNELLFEEMDSRNAQENATEDAIEWVETFGYHCPEVEVRS